MSGEAIQSVLSSIGVNNASVDLIKKARKLINQEPEGHLTDFNKIEPLLYSTKLSNPTFAYDIGKT